MTLAHPQSKNYFELQFVSLKKIKVEDKEKGDKRVKVKANISIKLFAEDIAKLVIMLKIVKLLLKKFQSLNNTWKNDQEDDGLEYVFTKLQNLESTMLQVSTYLKSDYEDVLILDTGETQHMTFGRDLYWTFNKAISIQ